MTLLSLKKLRITASLTTVKRLGISLAACVLGIHTAAAQQPKSSIADQVEQKVYFQKPAEKVVQAQAVAPPAPPPLFNTPVAPAPLLVPQPLPQTTPAFAPLAPITPNLQLAEIQESKSLGLGTPAGTPTQPPAVPVISDNSYKHNPPKREDVFRFENDATLKARIKNEIRQNQNKFDVKIPEYKETQTEVYQPRSMPPMQVRIEPAYVMHRRLFFEQKNSERAGWDLGVAQPILCATAFYKDCFLFPHKLASNFLEPYDTSAGKPLPGSPTPLLFYPPEYTIFGGTVGTAVVIGTAAILP